MADVDPQMQAILARAAAAPVIDFQNLPIAEARRRVDQAALHWNDGAPAVPSQALTIDLGTRRLAGRCYTPTDAGEAGLILFVHGGGWTFGSIETYDGLMRELALAARTRVLGFDYRLAPEHPFPAPLDDVLDVIAWIERGGLGLPIAAGEIVLAGDSAGANLALAALLSRRDDHRPASAGAVLFYGCYTPEFGSASHQLFGDGQYLLSTEKMRWYWRNFLGDRSFETTDLAAPLRSDLHGMPPTYLIAAGLDPLRDDTLALAARLAAAGCASQCEHIAGMTHGALRMSRDLDLAAQVIGNAGRFVTALFQRAPEPDA